MASTFILASHFDVKLLQSCISRYIYSILPITRTSKGPMKMVRVNESSSSKFEVLEQGDSILVRDKASSSYRGFELPGLLLYIQYHWKIHWKEIHMFS